MTVTYLNYFSPLGLLRIAADEKGICKLSVTEEDWQEYLRASAPKEVDSLPYPAREQLEQYFQKERKEFTLPLVLEGTSFYRQVWQQLCLIPYGETRSYGEIAQALGKPQGSRAVGQANRANPLPILIPCHRVIGKSGKLVGYAGTRTELKEFLLQLEDTEKCFT